MPRSPDKNSLDRRQPGHGRYAGQFTYRRRESAGRRACRGLHSHARWIRDPEARDGGGRRDPGDLPEHGICLMDNSAKSDFLSRIRMASEAIGRRVKIMEVCGTHTHAIARNGLKGLVEHALELISGPGCPVCVTARGEIERAIVLARYPGVTITTFGDMLRVPGIDSSLERERADGADVRVVYSPRDALELARSDSTREVVFLGVGFETTAPAIASVILEAARSDLANFSVFVSHKLIIPAMEAVLRGEALVDGFLTPGHVSVIIGSEAYSPIAREFSVPCVATGFAPGDILEGLTMLLEQLAEGRSESLIQYTGVVSARGNPRALAVMERVFAICDTPWRGLGTIPGSGLCLREEFREFNALHRFEIPEVDAPEEPGCRCGEVLKGLIAPAECPLFGKACTPADPVGPCMVSSEGSCAARYRYG